MKVYEAFAHAGIKIPGITKTSDKEFQLTCQTCGTTQRLSDSKVTNSEDITYYRCKNRCEQEIAMVYLFGSISNESGHAYRLKDYVVKSYSDLYIIMPNGAAVLLPK